MCGCTFETVDVHLNLCCQHMYIKKNCKRLGPVQVRHKSTHYYHYQIKVQSIFRQFDEQGLSPCMAKVPPIIHLLTEVTVLVSAHTVISTSTSTQPVRLQDQRYRKYGTDEHPMNF